MCDAIFFVDTCSWLNLLKDVSQFSTISAVLNLVNSGELKVVLPSQVMIEYKKNVENVLSTLKLENKGHVKWVSELAKKTKTKDAKEAKKLSDQVYDKYVAILEESRKEMEVILFEKALEIELTPQIIQRAVDRGLEKRKPFTDKKNSMADALIIESVFEYCRLSSNDVKHKYFVSSNTNDFCEDENKNKQDEAKKKVVHTDLLNDFNSLNLNFSNNLSEAVNRVFPGSLSRKAVEAGKRIAEAFSERIEPIYKPFCPYCGTEVHDVITGPKYLYGEFGWLTECPKCKKRFMLVSDLC